MKYSRFLILVFSSIVAPLSLYASLEITEVMYDAPGTDDGYEWIEVYNNGSESIDLSLLKLRESGVLHKLTPLTSGVIQPSGYAVIIDDITKFKSSFPSFSGVLLDSSFSLTNEGELIELVNSGGSIVDSLLYLVSEGGNGDGNTLNKSGSSWIPRLPSPASPIQTSQATNSPSSSKSQNTSKVETAVPHLVRSKTLTHQEPLILLPENVYAFADSRITLELQKSGYQPKGDTIYAWSFGDGTSGSGDTVTHTYRAPGTYLVVARMKAPDGIHEARTTVHILPLTVSVTLMEYRGDAFAEVTNTASNELSIGGWVLVAGDNRITMPPYTIVLPGSSAVVPLPKPLKGDETIFLIDSEGELVSTNKDKKEEGSGEVLGTTTAKEEDRDLEFSDEEQELLRAEAERALEDVSFAEDSEIAYDPYILSQGAAALLGAKEARQNIIPQRPSESGVVSFFERSKTLLLLTLLLGGISAYLLYIARRDNNLATSEEFAIEDKE